MSKKFSSIEKALNSRQQTIEQLRIFLSDIKIRLDEDDSPQTTTEFCMTSTKLRDLEFWQVIKWRQQAGIQWASLGDSSLALFFKAMKSRRKCKKMEELLLDNDRTITNEEDIMVELLRFYKKLFSKELRFNQHQEATMRRILRSRTRVLSDQKIRHLERKPTKVELYITLKSMAKGKSPGIDNITTEVYLSCWSFIENHFFQLVLHFWEMGELNPSFNEGVLKLIP